MSVEELKAALLDSFWGTERGLSASSDARAEINELITRLEAKNPTPQPNDAVDRLSGAWKLAYTSNSELIALLALGRLPLITVGDITQSVDGAAMTVENRVQLSAPFSRTSLAATAAVEVRSPKLLSVMFQEGRIATPELLADFAIPSTLEVMGQQVDLAPLQAALQPLDGPVRSLLESAGGLLAGVPDLSFPITSPTSGSSSTWLLNTYLDDDLRITRGDQGSVFVMMKDKASVVLDAFTEEPEPVVEPAIAAEAVEEVAVNEVVVPSAVIEEDAAATGSGI
jgi:hypothetical protein